jgi:hypothetical protein
MFRVKLNPNLRAEVIESLHDSTLESQLGEPGVAKNY